MKQIFKKFDNFHECNEIIANAINDTINVDNNQIYKQTETVIPTNSKTVLLKLKELYNNMNCSLDYEIIENNTHVKIKWN